MDTLSEDLDGSMRVVHENELRAITYRKVLPRFVDLLNSHNIKATFFVIGKDVDDNVDIIRNLHNDGHEIASHTMNHPKQLVFFDEINIEQEIDECGKKILAATGKYPVGFRAPGYTISPKVIRILRKLNYSYDASLNNALCYYVMKKLFKRIRLKDKEYITVQRIYDLWGKREPYKPSDKSITKDNGNDNFIEIPISVIPIVSYPFVSALLLKYGIVLSRVAYHFCRACSNFLNFELHINEFTIKEDVFASRMYNNLYLTKNYMKIPLNKRLEYYNTLFTLIKKHYEVVLLRDVRV